MTTDKARILAELSELLRSITDSLLPGEQITMQTRLIEDLEMHSLQLTNLTGRVQARYGLKADLVPFYVTREGGPFTGLTVGELVDYLAGVLDAADEPAHRVLGLGSATGAPAAAKAGGPAVAQPTGTAPAAGFAAAMPEAAPPPDPCAVIISSGRCGSTMLSHLIAQEPETLSASESLGRVKHRLLRRHVTEATQITGERYWAFLSETAKGTNRALLNLGVIPDEFRYPQTGRYAADMASVPPILRITLPTLVADPDELFDQLADRVPRFPRQPILAHHKMMLNVITNLTGRRRWVERSGGSSRIASYLLPAFPEARFVYLTRNVAATARSMSRHPAFQMGQVRQLFYVRYGVDPWQRGGRQALPSDSEIPEDIRRLLPGRITREAMHEAMTGDLPRFEALASHMHGVAEQALADYQPRHLLRIRYEDLVAEPLAELTRLGEFLGFADPAGWASQTAGQVRPPKAVAPQPA